jgi:hypothetical protein
MRYRWGCRRRAVQLQLLGAFGRLAIISNVVSTAPPPLTRALLHPHTPAMQALALDSELSSWAVHACPHQDGCGERWGKDLLGGVRAWRTVSTLNISQESHMFLSFLTSTGVASVNLSQNSQPRKWRAHDRPSSLRVPPPALAQPLRPALPPATVAAAVSTTAPEWPELRCHPAVHYHERLVWSPPVR